MLQDQKSSIKDLYVEAIKDNRPRSMRQWVDDIFEPTERKVSYSTARRRTMVNGQIGYHELRAVASQWDKEGVTGPMDFVKAVECEVEGTRKYSVVQEALQEYKGIYLRAA